MKVLLVVTVLMALASVDSASQEDQEFQDWKLKFDKVYNSAEEESQHKNAWLENQKIVLNHNMLADQGIESYRLGMTQFADMSIQEYNKLIDTGCIFFSNTSRQSAATFLRQTGGASLPDTVDWRDKGYVTGIKNQKSCGSCWAFSTTGALEGQTFKTTGKLVPLSEQQLVDCSRSFGNLGCQGGWMNQAFEYVKQKGGLDTARSYPYNGVEGLCRFNPATVGTTCTGYVNIKTGDEIALQEAVATIGPISVAIDTSQGTFSLYTSGVYDEPACNSSKLLHAVLIVGYGTENGKDYWLVKNSWGSDWGDAGYIKMSRNKNNQCGIVTKASYPLVSNQTQCVQCQAWTTVFVLGCLLFGMFTE